VNKNIRRILNPEQKVDFRVASVAIRQDKRGDSPRYGMWLSQI
jgi:hypothetical protein